MYIIYNIGVCIQSLQLTKMNVPNIAIIFGHILLLICLMFLNGFDKSFSHIRST